MSDYLVNPTDIVRIMNELNADNEKLAGKIEQLRQLHSELTGIWEGEADRVFQSVMTNGLALQKIGTEYAETELNNKSKIESL